MEDCEKCFKYAVKYTYIQSRFHTDAAMTQDVTNVYANLLV